MSAGIRIVLIDTTHPGNVGATARAMKNMGLDDLVLVRPQSFPDAEATARASGAADLLDRARVVATLDESIGDCGLILGTTARDRMRHFNVLDARRGAIRLRETAETRQAAVLFGAERTGLTNEELERCHALIRIPAHPGYESLNLAMAVQIVCYEIFIAGAPARIAGERSTPLASAEEMRRFYSQLEEVLEEVDFTDRTESGVHLMGRLRRLFNRAELDENEVNILRGLLTAVQGKRRKAGTR